MESALEDHSLRPNLPRRARTNCIAVWRFSSHGTLNENVHQDSPPTDVVPVLRGAPPSGRIGITFTYSSGCAAPGVSTTNASVSSGLHPLGNGTTGSLTRV